MEQEPKENPLSTVFDLKSRSLSKELTVSLILLIILFEGVLLGYIYNRQSRFLFHELNEQADDYAHNLGEILMVPIWDYDDEQISKIGTGYAENDIIDEIRIIDQYGRTLFNSRKKKESNNRIERSIPVVYKDQVIGRAELFFSLDAYKLDLVWLRNAILLILAGFLVAILITTGILLRVLMRKPLGILQKGIDRVAKGDYSYKFEEIRHRELVGIAHRFSEMASEIQIREHSLQEINTDLLQEIAERKRAEEKSMNAMAYLESSLESTPDGVFMLDDQSRFTYVNSAFLNWFGCEQIDFIGKTVKEAAPLFMSYETEKSFIEQVKKRLATGKAIVGEEIEVIDKNGNPMPVSYSAAEIKGKDRSVLGNVVFLKDITKHKQAELALRESEDKLARLKRMESLGLMAGGIAHDLNNILSGIVSYPDILLMDLPEDSPLRKPVYTIKESGQRAADVVSDLLTIARGVAMGKSVSNLNFIVNSYLTSAEFQNLKQTNPLVRFKTELEPDLLNINCSLTHLKKTLMNLVSNAAESINKKGKVTISTMNRYLDEPLKGYEDVRQGEYTILSVADDGSGISPEDLERIFEPFYTKKVMGRSGTGLGLAVVWNTVQDHEGYIDVRSSEKGTTFDVYFPITRREITAEEEHLPLAAYLGNGEKILVVDDEANQRDIACRLLSRLGYSAEAVANGEDAVEYLKRHPVDLIVLDMIMFPGMNGYETYSNALKINPNQKAVIASGFAETEDVKAAQRLGAGKFIRKPYTLEKIGLAVRDELKRKTI